jgi:hypothetical protein
VAKYQVFCSVFTNDQHSFLFLPYVFSNIKMSVRRPLTPPANFEIYMPKTTQQHHGFPLLVSARAARESFSCSCSGSNRLSMYLGFGERKRVENGGKIPRRKNTKKVCYHDSFIMLVSWYLVVH